MKPTTERTPTWHRLTREQVTDMTTEADRRSLSLTDYVTRAVRNQIRADQRANLKARRATP